MVWSEFDIISLFKSKKTAPYLVRGIGDDAAVISAPNKGESWVMTQDLLTEGIHFRRDWISARDLATKAIAVNLSDLAAMGATPRFLLLTLGLPKTISDAWIASFARHFLRVCAQHKLILIGGDTCASDHDLSIHVTAIGSAPTRNIVYRTGAKDGDCIYTSGSLGASAVGLECLKRGVKSSIVEYHLRPPIRTAFAQAMAAKGFASAMTDISDGLLLNLESLCADSLQAHLDRTAIPIDAMTERVATRLGADALALALGGGEDYELVFTVPARKEADFVCWCREKYYGVYKLGKMSKRSASHREKIILWDETHKEISLKGVKKGYQGR